VRIAYFCGHFRDFSLSAKKITVLFFDSEYGNPMINPMIISIHLRQNTQFHAIQCSQKEHMRFVKQSFKYHAAANNTAVSVFLRQ